MIDIFQSVALLFIAVFCLVSTAAQRGNLKRLKRLEDELYCSYGEGRSRRDSANRCEDDLSS